MVDREKIYLAGFVMGYEKATTTQIGASLGADAYREPNGETGVLFASGYKKGLEDAASMVQKLVDGDANDMTDIEDIADAMSGIAHDFLKADTPNRYSYKWKACDDADDCLICDEKNCIHHPDYQRPLPPPVYLDTSVTDLCEALKQIMASAVEAIQNSEAAYQLPFLEHLIEEADAIETQSVRDQVDEYYGTK